MKSEHKNLLAVFFLAGSFILAPGVASAEDVWCGSSEGLDQYLVSESINAESLPKGMDYRAAVKMVRQDSTLDGVTVYGFEMMNDTIVGSFWDKAAGRWQYAGHLEHKPDLKAIWEAMKPYMREKGIPYSDSWR